MLYKASAPGSLMLLGEYAVLEGKPALVCALDKRITVTLTPRADKGIHICTEALGAFTTTIKQLKIIRPFQFVTGALCHFAGSLEQGCDISVSADFSSEVGFGSSAAVTVATLAVLAAWRKKRMPALELLRRARQVILKVQQRGSGADAAAAVYGGIVSYQQSPLKVKKFNVAPAISVLYSGRKFSTVAAIEQVRERFKTTPQLYKSLCQAIGQCSVAGVAALRKNDWAALGQVMNIQQGLMDSLGVNTAELQALVSELRSHEGITGAKISGAGMGDCVIGLGKMAAGHKSRLTTAISLEGVIYE